MIYGLFQGLDDSTIGSQQASELQRERLAVRCHGVTAHPSLPKILRLGRFTFACHVRGPYPSCLESDFHDESTIRTARPVFIPRGTTTTKCEITHEMAG